MPLPPDVWPLFALRVRTGDLELRVPIGKDIEALTELAAEGIHDPSEMPFSVPWTDAEPIERARSVLRWHWGLWSSWRPDAWNLDLAVLRGGEVVGTQSVAARRFAVLREVDTGSWLGRAFQGRGIGTRMREAALHLAFMGLGAETATTTAWEDNLAGLAVSQKLGYEPNGVEVLERRGDAMTARRFRMTRERWLATERPEAEIEGLEACRDWFGIPD